MFIGPKTMSTASRNPEKRWLARTAQDRPCFADESLLATLTSEYNSSRAIDLGQNISIKLRQWSQGKDEWKVVGNLRIHLDSNCIEWSSIGYLLYKVAVDCEAIFTTWDGHTVLRQPRAALRDVPGVPVSIPRIHDFWYSYVYLRNPDEPDIHRVGRVGPNCQAELYWRRVIRQNLI